MPAVIQLVLAVCDLINYPGVGCYQQSSAEPLGRARTAILLGK